MKHGERKAQILDLVRERQSIALKDLKESLGMTSDNASVALHFLSKQGHLIREGQPTKYRYRLPSA